MKNNGTVEIKWIANPNSEFVMRKQAITFKVVMVKLDEIDFALSLQNQAREVAMHQDVRERYKIAMHDGSEFPMCVLAPIPEKDMIKTGKKRLMFLDGNHRAGAAHDVGAKEIKAYLIDPASGTEAEIYGALPRLLNEANGIRLSTEESVAHAIHDISIKLRSIEEAAKDYHLTVDMLRQHLRAAEVKVTLENADIRVPNHLRNKTTLAPLGRIPLESVQIAAGRLVIDGDLPKSDVEALVRNLTKKTSKNEAAQIAAINDYAQKLSLGEKQERKTPAERVNHKTRVRLMSWITTGESIWKGKTKLSQFDVKDVDNVIRRLRHLEKRIHTITVPGAN